MPELPDPTLTESVIAAAFEVSNVLGPGFLEKVCERGLAIELRARSLHVQSQPTLSVRYKGHLIGEYSPDLLVNHELILELKCADRLTDAHTAQCLNYLKASNLRLALLLNFQHAKLEWRRVAL